MIFSDFAKIIHERWLAMCKNELYVTEHDTWPAYLAAFPEGSDPVYKTNTEHNCSCCKHFVRNIGNVVDESGVSVWDVEGLSYPYKEVAEALAAQVAASPIRALFRKSQKESRFGAQETKQLLPDGVVKRWNHFYAVVPARHLSPTPDKACGDYRTTVEVFTRGLIELKPEAVQQVLDLIDSNALYRGAEHRKAVKEFMDMQAAFQLTPNENDFVWTKAKSPAARFRNTVIGTLVQDISEGKDLEHAVRSFETKVAPTNYKRTTALITPGMVKTAMAKINELGLEPALQRRFARISDVSVNNVLWVNNESKSQMRGGLENMLLAQTVKSVSAGPADDISFDEFMKKIMPSATDIELLVQHPKNFVSITAPVHEDVAPLFKWNNNFAWSYDGNITDSIKEKVKAAGGNVTNAELRVSLAWWNHDDLDLHVIDPSNKRICYYDKRGKYGTLDVDMNAGHGHTRTPVENVSWTQVPDGKYKVIVNQFSRRETSDVGYTLEIESESKLAQYSYNKGVSGENHALTLTLQNGKIVKVETGPGIEGGGLSQSKWGLKTETFVKVNTIMYSPNFWDDNKVGNKHVFFILDGCKNDEPTRGIYNEFLRSGLEEHRKVFEVVGDKTKCPVTDEQLSGVGFSSTNKDTVTVKVGGRVFNINF